MRAAAPAMGEDTSSLKVPPHSIEAEQSVLGGVLIDNDAWETIAGMVAAEDFYRKDHRAVFRAVEALADTGQPCDVVTVAEWLESRQQLDDAGGLGYLAALADGVAGAGNIKAYADIVRNLSVRRQLIRASGEIGDMVFTPEGRSNEELLNHSEELIFRIAEKNYRGDKSYESIKDLSKRALEKIETLYESKSEITGLSTGFCDLDRKTAGLQNGELIIIAGRPSMGKTALAINIAQYMAITNKLTVALFSMEMSALSLAIRMISSLGRIDQQRVRTGRIKDGEWSRVKSAMDLLREGRLMIDDTPALAPGDLRARCRRIYREHKRLDLVVVDYLQLMHSPGHGDNRVAEMSEISRSLKAMARELDVPVIALSQLNRGLESRNNKRPIMSDLRESGAIEQDADLILFIYREEVYKEDTPDKGKAEIIIAKQRNGPIGKITLTFENEFALFESYVDENQLSDYGDAAYASAPGPDA